MAMGGRMPPGDWWQDTAGKWHEGGRPDPLPPSLTPVEPLSGPRRRPSTKRKGLTILGLWLVAPIVVTLTANVDDSTAVGWVSIAVVASPGAFAFRDPRWNVSRVLGVVGGFSILSSVALCFLTIVFVASPATPIGFGLLLAFLAAAAALVLLLTGSLRLVVSFESLAAIGAAAAITLIALHSRELHHVEGGAATTTSVESWSFLYVVWALAGAMFAAGAILALRPRR
jgi:hypothetical protein